LSNFLSFLTRFSAAKLFVILVVVAFREVTVPGAGFRDLEVIEQLVLREIDPTIYSNAPPLILDGRIEMMSFAPVELPLIARIPCRGAPW
jgi:hypothetical protein